MRRFFVIFLILLFPLNVFALSMSASGAQQGDAAALVIEDSSKGEARGDVDPDEPPSVADLHDIVNHESSLRLAAWPAGALPPHDAAPHSHSSPPPLKPPCVA
ncbi:hypothetical protein LQ564_17405 [Massilia sp. G4R7]|uniref:Uncharacterized protein n=1 Tax=Massilia phyllostachyos TaxID=2898585 RepID=A0ABS8Q8K4_9BURK|nr:hypothetical protein [Massilia phyllostachyos]MCD2518089.1 hypothetical protein [Massilia phyllostachyos]